MWRLLVAVPLLALWLLPDSVMPEGTGAVRDEVDGLLNALAYAGLAWSFARTLAPGEEPLIARYTRFDSRRDPRDCAGYARGLTLFWALSLGLVALADAAAAWRGVDLGWAPELALLALFLGEHVVRSLRFPAGGIAWPTQTLGAIIRAERARHG